LLVLGALIGYPFSLDQPVALERLLGIVLASALAILTPLGLRRTNSLRGWLLGVALAAIVAGGWVVAASGPGVFRGAVGTLLDRVFRPLFGLVQITDPIEFTNTRFIVGYNGLADLCLVVIFACGALLVSRPGRVALPGLAAVILASFVLLVGTGARGALSGLAAGICMLGLFLWPRRFGLLAVLLAPLALAVAAIAVFDKGLEFSSTAGRLTYWGDLARLLVEYPFTGVGLGVDTANMVALQYEINPDPERVFYAHNTFVQSYLEQGPFGALGMLLVLAIALAAIPVARGRGAVPSRVPLLLFGLGVVGGLEAHGLTDQVVTTNAGTLLLLLGLACIMAGLTDEARARLGQWTRRGLAVLAASVCVMLIGVAAVPGGRALALLNAGGLRMNQALLSLDPDSPQRASALADAEGLLTLALAQDDGQPAVLRDLAWVRLARFDDAGSEDAIRRAAASRRIDTFDMLQIAHVYRDLGFTADAYALASRAYTIRGRSPEDTVMQQYAQSTLIDPRARTLADQAEAAMRARRFAEAHSLFQQAAAFEPSNAYLQDRIGAAQRAIDRYGPGSDESP
jgi:O-antigen ligase